MSQDRLPQETKVRRMRCPFCGYETTTESIGVVHCGPHPDTWTPAVAMVEVDQPAAHASAPAPEPEKCTHATPCSLHRTEPAPAPEKEQPDADKLTSALAASEAWRIRAGIPVGAVSAVYAPENTKSPLVAAPKAQEGEVERSAYVCSVCMYGIDEPPCNHFICPRCGTEFGLDDWDYSLGELRRRWEASGRKFFDPESAISPEEPKEKSEEKRP